MLLKTTDWQQLMQYVVHDLFCASCVLSSPVRLLFPLSMTVRV